LHEDLLDFCHLDCQHTGKNLARILYDILKDFNIQTRLYCITTDNAGNNGTLVGELERLLKNDGISWDSSKHHIRCLAHILNLTVKAFLNKLKIAAPSAEQQFMDDSDDENVSDEAKAEREVFNIDAVNEFH